MIETYSAEITEIEELGGASNPTESSTVVCDRCGFAYPREELAVVDGREFCPDCIDKE